MSDVPEEIWREILSKLPVTPLLRCRCVSKPWKCLIDSDQFIKHHLDNNNSKKPSNTTKLIIVVKGLDLYSAADFDLLIQTNRANFKQLTHPLKAPPSNDCIEFMGRRIVHPLAKPPVKTEVLGSCDGLLALTNDADDDTIVWNPSIKRFHDVPYTRIEYPDFFHGVENIVFGFGYDVVSNDYKLVRMVQYYRDRKNNIVTEVKVYSLKSSSWRRIPDFPYSLKHRRTHGVFVNGALHWIVTRKVKEDTPDNDFLLAAYDLGTEEVRLVPLPEMAGDYQKVAAASLGGCLCLLCYERNEDREDIWVMKEYGVEESWLILFTIDLCDFDFMTPLSYSRCGRKVLVEMYGFLVWYDLDKKSTYKPKGQKPLEGCIQMYTCLQTLVLLNSGTCDFDLFTKKKQEPKTSSTPRNDYHAKCRNWISPAVGRANGNE